MGVVKSMKEHPLRKMFDERLLVTVNSDDPAYFGGYINENYIAVQRALRLDAHHIFELAKNSFQASFLSEQKKQEMLARLESFRAREG
ncbi:MAG: hypothetical protein QXQ50_04915 [Candidatus Bathyarchaeia archaeon]